jgi:hypothetical protein
MSAAALEAFFRTAARPAAAAASPAGGPEAAAGGGVVAEDERGRLYVAGADGLLRCADARAVAAVLAGGAVTEDALRLRVFAPAPPLPFVPTSLVVSPGGQHAALAGAPHS